VRRRRVNDPDVGILYKRYRLTSTIVGKAQKHDVGGIEELATLLHIVTLVLVYAEQLQVIARPYTIKNL
jgi:hypothetical protein